MSRFSTAILDIKNEEIFDNEYKIQRNRLSPSLPLFQHDSKLSKFQMQAKHRISLPLMTDEDSPSKLLILKVKSKIDQQISPNLSARNLIQPLGQFYNSEKRPNKKKISLQVADSLPDFECPFNMIKNLQKLHTEQLMLEYQKKLTVEKLVDDKMPKCSSYSVITLSDDKGTLKSRSSIELNVAEITSNDIVCDDFNINNKDTCLYKDLLYYLTGQACISRGSIEEFHRTSQPDLFLQCLNKMKSDITSLTDQKMSLNCPSSLRCSTSLTHCNDESCQNHSFTESNINNSYLDGTFGSYCEALTMTNHLNVNINQQLNTNGLRSHSKSINEKYTTWNQHNNTNNAIIRNSGEIVDNNISIIRDYCQQLKCQNSTIFDKSNTPGCVALTADSLERNHSGTETTVPYSPRPNNKDINWSVAVNDIYQRVSVVVASEPKYVLRMTEEQLELYKLFIQDISSLNRKGIEVIESSKQCLSISNGELLATNSQESGLIEELDDKNGLASNGVDRTDQNNNVNVCFSTRTLSNEDTTARDLHKLPRPNNNTDYNSHKNVRPELNITYFDDQSEPQEQSPNIEQDIDPLVRMQIENTGLRVKVRDLAMKLRRAEDLLNLGPGENENDSMIDKLLKNTNNHMNEAKRLSSMLDQDHTTIKDLEDRLKQVTAQHDLKTKELTLELDSVRNEVISLQEKHKSCESSNQELFRDLEITKNKCLRLGEELDKERIQHLNAMQKQKEEFQALLAAMERDQEVTKVELRHVSDDFKWAMNEKQMLEEENNRMHESDTCQKQMTNELLMEITVLEGQTHKLSDLEIKLKQRETTIQQQQDDLLAWEEEYAKMTKKIDGLLGTIESLRSENHILHHHAQEQRTNVIVPVENGRVTENSPQLSVSQLNNELADMKMKYRDASHQAKKNAHKTSLIKENLRQLQEMHETYCQHMTFKYKNVAQEFKKRIENSEAENRHLCRQVDGINVTNYTLNQAILKKNNEISKLTEDLKAIQLECSQLNDQIKTIEMGDVSESVPAVKLKKTKPDSCMEISEMPQLKVDRIKTNNELIKLQHKANRLEVALNIEKMLHDITKNCLRNTEDDLSRLQHASRSLGEMSTSYEKRSKENHHEQVERKIREHQQRAEKILSKHSNV